MWLGKLIPLQIAHWGPSHDYFSTPSKVEEPTLWIFQEKLQKIVNSQLKTICGFSRPQDFFVKFCFNRQIKIN